jgi:hypothetical protein
MAVWFSTLQSAFNRIAAAPRIRCGMDLAEFRTVAVPPTISEEARGYSSGGKMLRGQASEQSVTPVLPRTTFGQTRSI